MSPTDNIVSFKGTAQPTTTEAEEMSEREDAIAYLATFLLDNKDTIKNFVCGISFQADGDGDQAFHMLTSPIDVAELALTLRLLEDGFCRYLPSPD
jgi:hypothetical protein